MNRKYLDGFNNKNRKQIKAIYDVLNGDNDELKENLYGFLINEMIYFLARNGVDFKNINKIFNYACKIPNDSKEKRVQRLFKDDCKDLNDFCFICGATDTKLTNHHVFRQSEHKWLKYNPNYIVKLCDDCHRSFHMYKDNTKDDRILELIKGEEKE